jgi:hypothetical protein
MEVIQFVVAEFVGVLAFMAFVVLTCKMPVLVEVDPYK